MADHPILKDTLIGLAAGYVGVKAMGYATTRFQELESNANKEREKRVSPGVSYDIAAKYMALKVGMPIGDKEAASVGTALHLGLGLSTGLVYMVLSRAFGWSAPASALTAAGTLFVGIDEGLNSAMGWSAPPREYPLATHLRGAAGHAVLGIVTAVTAEFLSWSLD